jgi:hypothetical protein
MVERALETKLTRRGFLRAAAGSAFAVLTPRAWAGETAEPARKTVLSFYCDDTSPYGYPPDTFKRFLDFVSAEGVAGESTVLLGAGWPDPGPLSRPTTDLQRTYLAQLRRAFECGIDSHMEIMTHGGLFDFEKGVVPEGATHEGLWLHEPAVSVATYQDYFAHIIAEGERVGVRFTGLTWPGCSCPACTKRYQELAREGVTDINPNVWQALLALAKQGRFRGPTVPIFPAGEVPEARAKLLAGDGKCAVYDLSPTAGDQLGSYTNSPDRANADYYITADGERGRIVRAVRTGAPFCIFYAHWQGLNPATGAGWPVFQTVVKRIHTHLGDRVVWRRPSAYTDSLV